MEKSLTHLLRLLCVTAVTLAFISCSSDNTSFVTPLDEAQGETDSYNEMKASPVVTAAIKNPTSIAYGDPYVNGVWLVTQRKELPYSDGGVYMSSDGEIWEKLEFPLRDFDGDFDKVSFSTNKSEWGIVGRQYASFSRSPHYVGSWNMVPSNTRAEVKHLIYANSKWFAFTATEVFSTGDNTLGSGGDYYMLTRTSGTNIPTKDIAYGNGIWLGVGSPNPLYADGIMESTDGINWRRTSKLGTYNTIVFSYGLRRIWVTGSENGEIYTSNNCGAIWTKQHTLYAGQTGNIDPIVKIVEYAGLFVAVGRSGAVAASYGGYQWLTNPYEKSDCDVTDVAFDGVDKIIVIGNTVMPRSQRLEFR